MWKWAGVIGGVVGAVFGGLVVPYLLAMRCVSSGVDPTGCGAFAFLGMITLPVGAILGRLAGLRAQNWRGR